MGDADWSALGDLGTLLPEGIHGPEVRQRQCDGCWGCPRLGRDGSCRQRRLTSGLESPSSCEYLAQGTERSEQCIVRSAWRMVCSACSVVYAADVPANALATHCCCGRGC